MNKGPIPPAVVQSFWTLAIPILLTMTSARLLLSEAFLAFEYQRHGFPSDMYGFTPADRLAYSPYALRFLFNGEAIDYLAELRLPGDKCWNLDPGAPDCRLFSARELEHMRDVKGVVSVAFGAALVCASLGGATIVSSLVKTSLRVNVLLGMRQGSILTLLAVACLAVFSLSAWERAFDLFHQLFFADGTWRFPFSDSLIRLYPEQLFFDAAVAIALLASVGAGLIFLGASRLSMRA